MKKNKKNTITQPVDKQLDEFILSYTGEAPNFYDDDICEQFYVPVNNDKIFVYHYKPQKSLAKRPIVFIPGYGTVPISWRDFHNIQHEKSEYYYLETREKKSSIIKRNKKGNLSIDRYALDLAQTIEYLGLSNRDYVILASCLSGGVLLHALNQKYINPPTAIIFDPFTKWIHHRFVVKFIMPIVPAFIFGMIKFLIVRLLMINMKNKAQIERNLASTASIVAWKWRRFSLQNVNFDLTDDFKKIDKEILVFHGPKDKFHPIEAFHNVATQLPKGRFFHLKTSDHLREFLVGVIAFEFAKIAKDEEIPKSLISYEVELNRN